MKADRNRRKNLRFSKRLRFALKGVSAAWKREVSFRFQTACAVALVAFCFVARPSPIGKAVFALAATVALAWELVTNAIESLLDRLHPEEHPESGFAKDCMAGAVLTASVGSVLVFLICVIQRFVFGVS